MHGHLSFFTFVFCMYLKNRICSVAAVVVCTCSFLPIFLFVLVESIQKKKQFKFLLYDLNVFGCVCVYGKSTYTFIFHFPFSIQI